jgi:hypothetical protein
MRMYVLAGLFSCLTVMGCVHDVVPDIARPGVADSVPTALVPDAAGKQFATGVSLCEGYAAALSDFSSKVHVVQKDSASNAFVGGLISTAAGAVFTGIGARWKAQSDNPNTIPVANTLLIGGIVTALLGIPISYFAYKSTAQDTEASAANTASQSIEAAIKSGNADLMKAAAINGTNQDNDRTVQAYLATSTMVLACKGALKGQNVPVVKTSTDLEERRRQLNIRLRTLNMAELQ